MSKPKECRRVTVWKKKSGSADSYERQFDGFFTAAQCDLAWNLIGALTGLYLDALRNPHTWNSGCPTARAIGDRLVVVERV